MDVQAFIKSSEKKTNKKQSSKRISELKKMFVQIRKCNDGVISRFPLVKIVSSKYIALLYSLCSYVKVSSTYVGILGYYKINRRF